MTPLVDDRQHSREASHDDAARGAVHNSRGPGDVLRPPGEGVPTHDRPPAGDAPRSDERLLADYRGGDKGAFVALVKRYERELFHFLARFLGDRASAEDIFQEAFLQVHQSADQFDPARRFKPWLFTIAANKARDLRRSRARRPTQPLQASLHNDDQSSGEFIDLMQAVQEGPTEPLERKELEELVRKTVSDMPDPLREVLLLAYFQQFPYKQISEMLGVPLGTVKSRLHSAVAFFAAAWKKSNRGRSAS